MKTTDATARNVEAFKAELAHWAAKIRVKPRQVRIQRMRRKWASCSTAGTVCFNYDLLREPREFREYVIVHELLHLKVPNHGKLFKSLLRAFLPQSEVASAFSKHLSTRRRQLPDTLF